MSSYPVIVIPDILQNVELQPISKPTKPIYPKQPKPPRSLPPKFKPIKFLLLASKGIIGLEIILFFGLFLSLFNFTLGAFSIILGLVILLVFMMLNNLAHLKTFSQRKQAHESLQQRHLLKLDNYSLALSEFDRRKAIYNRELQEYKEALNLWEQQCQYNNSQLKSILTDLITYQGKNSKAQRGYSEHKFETYLRQYFGSKIKVGLWLKNPNYDRGFHYTPDFAYIDEKTNLHIDIEIDEPYAYKSKKPLHYSGLQNEKIRDEFFLDCLWIVIRFSEEQVVKYPQSCCQEIAKVINQITGDNSILSSFTNIKELPPDLRWTYDEAQDMANQNYRENYLPN